MAKFQLKGLQQYVEKLAVLESPSAVAKIIKYAVWPGAGIVADSIKAATPVGKIEGGDLRDSMYLTSFKDDNGYIYTQVKWDGFDHNNTPNALKANVLETGRSDGKGKHPFIHAAVKRVQKQAEAEIKKALLEKIDQIMK